MTGNVIYYEILHKANIGMMNMIDNHIITINLMPKSQSQESTPEWERIDHSCSIGGSFPVILANSYQFVYCTSHQQASTKVLNMFKTFVFPMQIHFIPGYVHWKRVVFFFVAHQTCCILGCSYCILVVLTVYYVVHTCTISPENSAK